ncbi:hypothetical protein XF_1489 [Xylella fastidiosa 9a5c]|uniref:Thioredoxin family protein n=2 Tax=Xylella fastidiosa TaxID=2371 RepID=Q9PD90_XYLFA|nr:hypothetical protein XF_1489 [Xylella fastidiosa 9a5c]
MNEETDVMWMTRMNTVLLGSVLRIFLIAFMILIAACQVSLPDSVMPRPVDTTMHKLSVADPTQPVTSGNTPTAADIAAVAALNAEFDPGRDPVADLATAKVEAKRGGKQIILSIGSKRCSWCRVLDEFINGDSEIRSFRDAHFIWMKVNVSDENKNEVFLARFPKVKNYPHLFVLDADAKLLNSRFTADFEKGHSYDRRKFFAFLRQSVPSKN